MDFISAGVIASTVYDVLKKGVKLGADVLKDKLGQWIKDDIVANAIASELSKLDINDELSEKAIIKKLDQSHEISEIINSINTKVAQFAPSTITHVNQVHSGGGDNVAGNKIVN